MGPSSESGQAMNNGETAAGLMRHLSQLSPQLQAVLDKVDADRLRGDRAGFSSTASFAAPAAEFSAMTSTLAAFSVQPQTGDGNVASIASRLDAAMLRVVRGVER